VDDVARRAGASARSRGPRYFKSLACERSCAIYESVPCERFAATHRVLSDRNRESILPPTCHKSAAVVPAALAAQCEVMNDWLATVVAIALGVVIPTTVGLILLWLHS